MASTPRLLKGALHCRKVALLPVCRKGLNAPQIKPTVGRLGDPR